MSGRGELLVMSEEPVFDNVDEERLYRKQHLAIAFRAFALRGYNTGYGGHAAVRDPAQPDWFWTNPFGRPFELIRTSDLLLVDSEGALAEGDGIVNRAAFAIHAGIHRARPDVVASVHLHGVSGMAFSALAGPLRPITQDSCAFFEDHAVYDEFDGPALEPVDGQRMAKTLGPAKAMILANHGLLTVGSSIDAAAFWMIRLQTCAQVQMLAESTGRPVQDVPADLARHTAQASGTDRSGWFGFQTPLQLIVATQPDVLE
ncbi:class II aldolase/adducin family protein [Frankia gtarii]|uniref:class II aldolase/adducin family protein n=1 Tax=Frankia gtarii TaxID=2950102 RepID=UPI0021C0D9E8|nr:class II aldolase/adducin family protein [Frankia gtarii]